MDISIIISYKESHYSNRINYKNYQNYRKFNIIKVLTTINENLNNFNIEIVIVEQDNKSTIDWIDDISFNENIDINHIFVKNDNIFNKGWGYNIGVNNCKYDNIIFQDSDIVLDKYSYNYIELVDNKKYDIVKPYYMIKYLNYIMSHRFLIYEKDFDKLPSISQIPSGKIGVLTGGSFFIRKENYIKIKGFDEKCYGYGYEDDIVDKKIKNFNLNIFYDNKYKCLHLFHFYGKSMYSPNINEYYTRSEKNKELYHSIQKMSKNEFFTYIEKIKEFGEFNNEDIDSNSIL